MFMSKTIAVVVPAYNEEKLIGRVIDTMPSLVDRIVVVDDCSRDSTAAGSTTPGSPIAGSPAPRFPCERRSWPPPS